jgi:hypothetical protein
MKNKMTELKALLKEKATEIRNKKRETKEYQRKHGGCCGGRQWTLMTMKSDYRHHHIAYSEMLGRKREEIEKATIEEWNRACPLYENKIQIIKEKYYEDVCVDSE